MAPPRITRLFSVEAIKLGRKESYRVSELQVFKITWYELSAPCDNGLIHLPTCSFELRQKATLPGPPACGELIGSSGGEKKEIMLTDLQQPNIQTHTKTQRCTLESMKLGKNQGLCGSLWWFTTVWELQAGQSSTDLAHMFSELPATNSQWCVFLRCRNPATNVFFSN